METEMGDYHNSKKIIATKARVYADVLSNKSQSYFEHELYKPQTDDVNNYSLIKKIGQGKFSLVFEGMHDVKGEPVVVKILKPIKKLKINREIKILEMLRSGINIVKLLAVVSIPNSDQMGLVFCSDINNKDCKEIYLNWSGSDIRYYTMEILKALDFCHSHGIMHRDVKPHNIIVNENKKRLQLIDFGLSEYYRPGEHYNVRVASRYYKGPELLVDYPYYDYSLDMWSLGCIFAAMIFRKEPFFQGYNNENQLYVIVKVLGTKKFFSYLKKYNIPYFDAQGNRFEIWVKKDWERFISSENEHLVNNEALDLLDNLLCFDHMERLTAREAMDHIYFMCNR